MKRIFSNTRNYILKLKSKIAFYPTILSFLGLLFAFLMIYLESRGMSKYLIEHAPILVINNEETARSLMTTFIAGLISIMVFSFSMVMILLNQASSNYSPRVLPGLISNRRHQMILGIYNSSLLYCIFTLVSIEPTGNKYQLPGFSVLFAIGLMTLCLGAFIYFVHSISQEIQINNIMSRIFSQAEKRLNKLIEEQNAEVLDFPETDNWQVLKSVKSGYIQDISLDMLEEIAKEHKLKLKIVPYKGLFLSKKETLIFYEPQCSDEVKENLISAFHYSKSELIEDNYVLAFKQLTEIAVKAMSPGINDPGTAINAIDYLAELFSLRLKKSDNNVILDDEGNPLLLSSGISFKDLINTVFKSLRTYCKGDIIIVEKLMNLLSFLKQSDAMVSEDYRIIIVKEIEKLYEDASKVIENEHDLDVLKKLSLP